MFYIKEKEGLRAIKTYWLLFYLVFQFYEKAMRFIISSFAIIEYMVLCDAALMQNTAANKG